MRRAATLLLAIALGLAALSAAPAVSGARVAYFTGSQQGGGYAAPVDLGNGLVGGPISVATEGPAPDVAISPDGSTAYVTGPFDELPRIDVATNAELPPLEANGEPWAIAISPDGARAFTANRFENSVAAFDLATGAEVGPPIPVGNSPAGIAVTPDGARAYVANEADNTVSVIDLATRAVTATIPVGQAPEGIAVTPDGKRVVVANRLDDSVSVVDVATNTASTPISVGIAGEEVAISPDGGHAYVLSQQEGVAVLDLTTSTASAAVPLSGFAGDLAILPDGSRAFVTREVEEGQSFVGQLMPFGLASNAFGSPFEIGERPQALAIVPDQPPHAAFTVSPQSTTAGSDVAFDGGPSSDSDGKVVRYDWEFGDGSSAANAGPAPRHVYSGPGTYQVTLTVTDDEGCSTQIVYTGQTAYCNGSGIARVTHPVTVSAGRKCASLSIRATSFKPQIRPGHTVPGVRVRLAPSVPSTVEVRATLLRQRNGRQANVSLGKLDVTINRWRRVRFVIPPALRDELQLGATTRVKFAATLIPLDPSTCVLKQKQTPPVLRLRVVKVFANAVQAARPR